MQSDAQNEKLWESLSAHERELMLWRRLHGTKRLPSRLSLLRRMLHRQGLLQFDDSPILSQRGEQLVDFVLSKEGKV